MNVLYVIEQFPVFSQTFVYDEILNHLNNGADVNICVLGSKDSADFPLESCPTEIQKRTYYLNAQTNKGAASPIKLAFAGAFSMVLSGKLPKALGLIRRKELSAREVFLGAIISRKFPEPGIIHCHFGNIGRIGLAAMELCAGRKALFVTFHAYEMTKSWFLPLDRYYRGLFRSQARLLPISDHWRSTLLRAGADPARIVTHRMGVKPPAEADGRAPRREGGLRLIQVGRMVEKKGHLVSIEALARLKQRRPDIAFTCDFIGDGPLEQRMRDRVSELDLEDNIRFRGSMRHEEVLEAVTKSDIFLLPSVTASDGDMEGIPVALMEAMARDVPVVTTRHSGIPELVEDGVNGLLTAEHDVDGLSHAIERMAQDAAFRERLAVAGGKRVREAFNQERLGEDLRRRYREVPGPWQRS